MRPHPHWFAVSAGLMAVVVGCGPSVALIKSYVITSPRRTIALMPMSVAPEQRDVRGACESAMRERLEAYGFVVVEKRNQDPSTPVFGPRTDAPRFEDVQAYGRNVDAPVVLVGRIERAQELRAGKAEVYRDQTRWGTDANGRRVRYTDRVVVKPERAGVASQFRLDLRLLDTETGRVIWKQIAINNVPEWPLNDAVRNASEAKAAELAEVYYSRKL